MNAFDTAIRFVLHAEGADSNDPRDPGGWTRYGISQRAHPDVDIAHLTEQAAVDIYRARYWDAYRLERLPGSIAIAVFDGAVQHGGRPAIRMLQHTVGTPMDGIIGPVTLAASYRMLPEECLTSYCARRAVYYASLATFGRFGVGWMRRLFALHLDCIEMIHGTADDGTGGG